jgi:hypothetical protein
MKKIIGLFGIFLWAFLSVGTFAQTQAEEKLFGEAKLLIFDEKWTEAQAKLDEFLATYPRSPLSSQVSFYKAKCLGEQKGREKEALKAYQDFLGLRDRNKSLVEESEVATIDLAHKLYLAGEKSYGREIEDRLYSPNRVIKYYAAVKLSYIQDKALASKSVPVLKEIVESEPDPELKDRARIALLRVSPKALKDVEETGSESRALILRFQVYDHRTKKVEVSLTLPWALADLALSSIVEDNKEALIKKGYDINRLRKELTRMKGNIIEIMGEEGKVIKIWIE